MDISNDYFNDPTNSLPTSLQPKEEPKKENDTIKPTKTELFTFLNTNANTILTLGIAVAIGFALKDFMNALVLNILQPSIMLIIMFIDKNNYLPITQSLRDKNISVDPAKFLGNMLVLKLVIGSMFFIYKYSNILL